MQKLKIVMSKAGRDKDRLFIVLKDDGDGYLEIADGRMRKIEKPKRKKLRHLETVCESYETNTNQLTNKSAAKIIRELNRQCVL